MALLAGLWPSPPMTPEEVMVWAAELTGRQRITPEEAKTVLVRLAESGIEDAKYRPRAGQIIAMVQALRRKRALDRPLPELPSGDDIMSVEELSAAVIELRQQIRYRKGSFVPSDHAGAALYAASRNKRR
jgi:hypothetical protein